MLLLDYIAENKLIAEAIKHDRLTESNFANLDYVKEWENIYTFRNITINSNLFKSLHVRITSTGTFINLFSDTSIFYDQSILFFGTNGIAHEKEPYIADKKEVPEFRRKLGKFNILNRQASVSVLKSEAYGSVIKITIIK